MKHSFTIRMEGAGNIELSSLMNVVHDYEKTHFDTETTITLDFTS